jgi:hypothetical protein
MSLFKASVLILAATQLFAFSIWYGVALIIAYYFAGLLDQFAARWLRTAVINRVAEGEIDGWQTDPTDSDWEVKGNMTRLKLPATDQLLFGRIIGFMRQTELAKISTE